MNKIIKNPYTGVQIRFGVMGSASAENNPVLVEKCKNLGSVI